MLLALTGIDKQFLGDIQGLIGDGSIYICTYVLLQAQRFNILAVLTERNKDVYVCS
jgi:hypothetical protein